MLNFQLDGMFMLVFGGRGEKAKGSSPAQLSSSRRVGLPLSKDGPASSLAFPQVTG